MFMPLVCRLYMYMTAMFDNHTPFLFWLQNKQTFCMFLLCHLSFVFCSLDLNILGAQRIMAFSILITHKSVRLENPISFGD